MEAQPAAQPSPATPALEGTGIDVPTGTTWEPERQV